MSQAHTPPPPPALHWDVSRSHRPADVAWPEPQRNDAFWSGGLDLTLALPGAALHLDLADAHAERRDDALTLLQLRGRPQTLDAALAELEQRLGDASLPRRDLDAWEAGVRSGDPALDHAFATRRNDLTPTLSLELKHSLDAERPWYLSWEIAWPAAAGPPPHPR